MLHKQTTQIRYQYDALDRLARHCRQGSVDRQRFYCESRLVSEIGGGEQVSIVQHGDHLLAQQRRDSDGLDNTLLAMDQQRSVLNTLLVNHQRPIAYSPYGYHHCESGLTSLPRFNGQRTESVTGHYLLGNGYRAFNPLLMRFNSPDKLSPFGEGGLNTYSYCQGDPVNRVDPSGGVGSFVNSGGRRMFVSHKEVSVTWFGESGRLIKDTYHGMPRLTIKGHGGVLVITIQASFRLTHH
ncbi:RHS repeat-associated core domain-containing protein [Pseudomonas sp. GM60]|uniref:RHS repeat-associated core domain-containing protein n=1 Tax=Pseudomonas sp. GM60 TaxID=1144334 RepID=UPI000270A60B|nr:RHS repeat-associated core domain-containing protein [Pseudomonas sp. GM60]EJM81218.1 RHS repeat-associated core domain protein-containing protein [Pseudomonas sp. GM60]